MDAGFIEFALRLKDELTAKLGDVQSKLSSFGSKALAGGAALTAGLTVPLAAAGASVIKLGMDAVESENLVAVSFGNMKAAADQWAAGLSTNLGLNRFETEKTAATLFNMTTNMGLTREAAFATSTGVVQLAADMASFRNIGMEEALAKIQAGLVGEAEPLKALGILVDDATVKAYAYANGIAAQGAQLSAAEKVTARWGAILQQTANDQGDLARTMESPSNQLRIMQARIEEAATSLGVALMPAVSQVVGVIASLVPYVQAAVQWFTALPGPVQSGVVVVLAIVAALGPLLLILGGVATGISALLPLLPLLGTAFAVMTGPIGLVVAAIVGLTAAWTIWGDDIQRIVQQTFGVVKQWLVDAWEGSIFQSVARMLEAMVRLFVALQVKAAEQAMKLYAAVKEWLLDKLQPVFTALAPLFGVVATAWTAAKAVIEGIVTAMVGAIQSQLIDRFNRIVAGIKAKVDAVTGFFKDMYVQVVGNSFVPDMVDGIALQFARLDAVMVAPARAAASAVRQQFKGLIGDVSSELANLAQVSSGTFAGVASDLASITAAIDASQKGMAAFKTGKKQGGTEGFLGMTAGILGMAAAAITAGQALKSMWDAAFGSKGRDVVKEFAASMGGFDALRTKLNALGAEGERLWIALTQGVGKNNPTQAKAAVDAITAALAGLGSVAAPTIADMEAAVKRYGGTLDDLGPKVQAMRVTEVAAGILADFKLIEAGGGALGGVYAMAADEVQKMLNQARITGAELPAHLKPYLQEMVNAGLLTDAAGNKLEDLSGFNFGTSLPQAIGDLVTVMKEFVATINSGAVPALQSLGNLRVSPIRIPVQWDYPSGSPGGLPGGIPTPTLPQFSEGTHGYQNFGAGTPVMLHGWEKVTPLGKEKTTSSQSSTSNRPIVLTTPDGRTLWSWMLDQAKAEGMA